MIPLLCSGLTVALCSYGNVCLFLCTMACSNLVMLAGVQFISLDLPVLSGCRDDFYQGIISVKPNLYSKFPALCGGKTKLA